MTMFTICKVHWKQIVSVSVVLHLLVHELPMLIIWLLI